MPEQTWREKFAEGRGEDLEKFREEMRTIAKDEKNLYGSSHFSVHFDSSELNADDMHMWNAFKDETMTRERIEAYRIRGRDLQLSSSREQFLSFFMAAATKFFLDKDMKDQK